ncbi:sensor domain-containing diguanylate cyclase [Beijerinckia sp. L45]|uniref:sensor domain-containing diguanylate cyclase n=1 Tax=Beijerinckia sp. L45 TaxID=1641855 RepID=UPI00131D16BD|nr:sensor domain-containing diguanylate cyclase [Beijerinckia sp. L45]
MRVSGREHSFELQTPVLQPDCVRPLEADRNFAALIADQARIIQEQTAYIARYKKMYDRSSALAKIGVWECDLATEALTWTDGVYDIFELPRGLHISRALTLDLYHEASRIAMSALRQKAIEACGSFQLDIRIRTAKGSDRWVRLSADIECEDGRAVRIFGLKQDITQEKEATDRMRVLAESDSLTGLANRSLFEVKLDRSLNAQHPSSLAALVLVDLDGFKQINDTYGHAAGDECLRQVSARIARACGRDDVVARIGGDEFAILVSGARNRARVEARVALVLAAIRPPILWQAQTFVIGASFGIAIPNAVPGTKASTLFNEADVALYAAKHGGGHSFRIFDTDMAADARVRRSALTPAIG